MPWGSTTPPNLVLATWVPLYSAQVPLGYGAVLDRYQDKINPAHFANKKKGQLTFLLEYFPSRRLLLTVVCGNST